MRVLKIVGCLLLGMNFVTCCTQKQEARKPVSHSSGEFMKQSVERNKKLNSEEESQIAAIIKKDSTSKYIASSKGYWYFYNTKSESATEKPIKGDTALFDYEIKDLAGKIIYTQAELKPQKYVVDKQNIMVGIRDGIKLMRKGEKVTFLFPSHIAFGYHGDNDRIGTNQPLICVITLNDIIKNKEIKVE
jgi:gliding motility-associated peptidyl-prolyl isomerase